METRERELKPWNSNSKDLEDELKKLGITKDDLKLGNSSVDKPLYLDIVNNPVDKVGVLKKVELKIYFEFFIVEGKVYGHWYILETT